MTENEIRIQFSKYGTEIELNNTGLLLLDSAKKALDSAYSPYSNFQVGAALLLSNGEIIRGSNQENAAYPSGLCAERTAIFFAGAQYPLEKVLEILVIARKTGTLDLIAACPCGACRQVLLEYEVRQNQAIPVVFKLEKQGFIKVASVSDLLPFKFDSSSL